MKILCLLGIIFGMELATAKPIPFRALYQANYKGLPINATGIRELREIGRNKVVFSSSASTFFTSIKETSLFSWNESIIPIEYKYVRQGLGKDKSTLITFNWENNIANYNGQSYIIQSGVIDRLAYQLQLRQDLAKVDATHRPIMDYLVTEGNQLKKYNFAILEEQYLQTSIGKFKTIKIDRIRDKSDRKTTFWLALEYNFLLIKLRQREPGQTFELLLKKAEINGRPITGS